MSMDLEPAGAAATAGLVAKELEGDAGQKAHLTHAAGTRCANCDTLLAGDYCHQCGQVAHVHRSLAHLLEELLHGVLHFDTKSWRTLPLLIARPGVLTRRYILGQRARYVSPLALFLFSVFLMFFVFSTLPGSGASSHAKTAAELERSRQTLTKAIEGERRLVAYRETRLAQAKTPQERATATDELADARSDLHESEISLAALNTIPGPGAPAAGGESSSDHDIPPAAKAALETSQFAQSYPRLARALRHGTANPELTLYKLKSSAYKFAFMLVPISLPFLWLMFFWRKGVTLYDHAIFTLYGLSFLSLWLAFMAVLATNSVTQTLVAPAILFLPVHLFLQLKETYVLSGFSALWRTFAMLLAGSLILLLFASLVLAIGLH